jgi:tRNA pseudouridine55 synthase
LVEGFLLIHKPAGITSFSCLGYIKRLVGKGVKVGHAGTLDKFATGLLIVGIGRGATKYLDKMLKMSKIYVGTGKLGELTDTYDPDGVVIERKTSIVTREMLETALLSFGAGYLQTPPVYSALKFQGKRLSDLQRAGREPSNQNIYQIALSKSRWISLYELSLQSFNNPLFTIGAHVSSGTYIRSLINDIAVKLDSCATTMQLERQAIGPFQLIHALEVEGLDLEQIRQNLIPVTDLLDMIDSYDLNN